MPVIDSDTVLADVIFWEDIIGGEVQNKGKTEYPRSNNGRREKEARLKPLTNMYCLNPSFPSLIRQ